jgi:hypothetical protein
MANKRPSPHHQQKEDNAAIDLLTKEKIDLLSRVKKIKNERD